MAVDALVTKKLRNSVVRINTHNGFGTGVFVYPGIILTCAHVVSPGITTIEHNHKPIPLLNQNPEIISPCEQLDLALVYVDYIDHPCVHLHDSRLNQKDDFIAFGFTARCPQGEDITIDYEGEIPINAQNSFIKVKKGQLIPGCSGSPLLNLSSGHVNGIVKYSWNPNSDFGGYAIPSSIILNAIPELKQKQSDYHKYDLLTEKEKKVMKLLREACDKKQPEEKQSLLEQTLHRLNMEKEDGVWYFEIARELGNIKPETIYEVVQVFARYGSPEDTLALLSYLKSSWVNPDAAEKIAEVIDYPQKQRAISINSKISFISQCYIERASANSFRKWLYVKTSNIHGENQAESLVEEINRVLVNVLEANLCDEIDPKTYLELSLKDMEKEKLPIFILVPGYLYSDCLSTIRENFPTLTIFFLDERVPINDLIQLDNHTIINLISQYIYFLEPHLNENEDLNIFNKLDRARISIKNIQ